MRPFTRYPLDHFQRLRCAGTGKCAQCGTLIRKGGGFESWCEKSPGLRDGHGGIEGIRNFCACERTRSARSGRLLAQFALHFYARQNRVSARTWPPLSTTRGPSGSLPSRCTVAVIDVYFPLSEKIVRLLELCLGIRPAGNEVSCRIEAAVTLDVTLILNPKGRQILRRRPR